MHAPPAPAAAPETATPSRPQSATAAPTSARPPPPSPPPTAAQHRKGGAATEEAERRRVATLSEYVARALEMSMSGSAKKAPNASPAPSAGRAAGAVAGSAPAPASPTAPGTPGAARGRSRSRAGGRTGGVEGAPPAPMATDAEAPPSTTAVPSATTRSRANSWRKALKEVLGMEATQDTAVASPHATPPTEPEEGEIPPHRPVGHAIALRHRTVPAPSRGEPPPRGRPPQQSAAPSPRNASQASAASRRSGGGAGAEAGAGGVNLPLLQRALRGVGARASLGVGPAGCRAVRGSRRSSIEADAEGGAGEGEEVAQAVAHAPPAHPHSKL